MHLSLRPQSALATPSSKENTTDIVAASLGIAGALAMVADIYLDMSFMLSTAPAEWVWVGLVILSAGAAMFYESIISAVAEEGLPSLVEGEVEEADVRLPLLDRWDSVCQQYGIDLDEPRADIWNFPSELRQILELDRVYLACRRGSKDRKRLKRRIRAIMHEVLGPLAAELAFLDASQRQLANMVQAADTELANRLNAIKTEQTDVVTAIYVQYLLETT